MENALIYIFFVKPNSVKYEKIKFISKSAIEV